MLISTATLLGLPVVTESGVRLGTVKEVIFDVASQAVREYAVHQSFLKKITPSPLLISPNEVVRITDKQMVVKDLVIRAGMAVPDVAV